MQDPIDTLAEGSTCNQNSKDRPTRNAKVKKTFVVIGIVVGVLLLLLGCTTGILQIKGVQTYVVGKVANKLSETFQADVQIAQFHYRPLSHLTIDSVYLSDQQHDTLAFIKQLELEFKPLALFDQRIDIQLLTLQEPYLNLQSRSDSTLNIQFLIDAFKTDSATFPYRLNIDDLILEQTRIRYNEMLVDQLDMSLTLPVLSMDSMDIQVHSLHLRAQLDRLEASFEADLHGNLDSLFAQDMQLIFRDQQLFSGNISSNQSRFLIHQC